MYNQPLLNQGWQPGMPHPGTTYQQGGPVWPQQQQMYQGGYAPQPQPYIPGGPTPYYPSPAPYAASPYAAFTSPPVQPTPTILKYAIRGGKVDAPDTLPLALRGRIPPENYAATVEAIKRILRDNNPSICNYGCLMCCCVGASIVANQQKDEGIDMVKVLISKENPKYAPAGVEWAVDVKTTTHQSRNAQGSTVSVNHYSLTITIMPKNIQDQSHLARSLEQTKADLEILKRQATMEQKDVVNISVTSSHPFQTLKFEELKITKQIGEGNFGTVNIATWRGSKVVVKQLKSSMVSDELVKDFVAEAGLCERVGRHPNVVSFIGACIVVPHFCLVSEFLTNGSVEDAIMEKKMFCAQNECWMLVRICLDAAAGLLHLHHEGVIHRDIAARNLLLDDQFRTKVCDFGMSRVRDTSKAVSQTKTNVGPLKWMSPESLGPKKIYSEKSDVWMFGCCMWEIFTRTEPFPNLDAIGAATSVLKDKHTMNPPTDAPPEIQRIMKSCWRFDPEKRPNMETIHMRLGQCLQRLRTEGKAPVGSPGDNVQDHVYQTADDLYMSSDDDEEEEKEDSTTNTLLKPDNAPSDASLVPGYGPPSAPASSTYAGADNFLQNPTTRTTTAQTQRIANSPTTAAMDQNMRGSGNYVPVMMQ